MICTKAGEDELSEVIGEITEANKDCRFPALGEAVLMHNRPLFEI